MLEIIIFLDNSRSLTVSSRTSEDSLKLNAFWTFLYPSIVTTAVNIY